MKGVSLSVSKANPAYFLYHKFGFRTLRENQEDFVMVLDFSKNRKKTDDLLSVILL